MTVLLTLMGLLAVPLWVVMFWLRRLAKDTRVDADSEFQEKCYHHLIDLSEELVADLHELKLALGGKADITKKQAPRLAKATMKDGERWPARVAALEVADRLNRLGQAVRLDIFDVDTVWDSNGETVLSAHRRVNHLVNELQERNPGMFPTYNFLVDELDSAMARRQFDAL